MSNGEEHYLQTTATEPRCPTCGSTERTPWHNNRKLAQCGTTADGFEFTEIRFKRTSCVQCGQKYVVKWYAKPEGSDLRTK